MAVARRQPRRTLLPLLAFMSSFRYGYGLTQSYCSSENTGSDLQTNIYQSNGLCHDQCVADYAFAIVQYQSCWCSNYAPADTVDVSECNSECPGYPAESCGNNDDGYYGYISLALSPSGTTGGSSSSATSTQTSSSQQSSTTQQTVSLEVFPFSKQITSDCYFPAASHPSLLPHSSFSFLAAVFFLPFSRERKSKSSQASTTSESSSSTSSSSTPSPTTTSSASTSLFIAATTAASSPVDGTRTTLVSTQVLTISGAPVTQTVTSTPMVANPGADQEKATKHSVSSGTIAGAVVGSVLGVALLLAGIFFFCWRRRRSGTSEADSTASARRKMERNTSVLSKTGLLSAAGATNDVEKSTYDVAPAFLNTNNRRQSALYGSENGGPSPVSPIAGGAGGFDSGSQRSRRNSRPLIFDQRLNPAAIMQNWESNGSRASIGTLQDQRDYSRPILNVTNPDPVDD
ncbi:hypothetical protein BDV97DRAFT_372958 [Delphinella strobiligena]|nr:hypothetical protein BDV97DRAFT_372958 [Delphinella strobiligena]